MSIPVDLADLARALADQAPGYLLTTTDGAVRAVSAEPEVTDGVLLIEDAGRRTCANIAANPAVTLLFPPREEHGYALLVDGTAALTGGDGERVTVTPTGAVLHRPRRHADGPPPPEGCGADCRPVG
ncbi:pyridoxamine 5'-phosphate oxidase family protein [Nocardioides pantholopis]|uniref:pyridoxamine 5'-phosphate oxidase family protein n=1 Tax=Nocardioides pantholopis TaxID=2483798 RepID=UPI000F07A113|nr:pyridoxamine 5'-phosphate oxidase family protein [Nocardioides pantholopis]